MTKLGPPQRRRLFGLGPLAALLALLLVPGIAVGSRMPALGVVQDALGHALFCPDGPFSCAALSAEEEIVRELRIPRTALALVTGLALGLAGALTGGWPARHSDSPAPSHNPSCTTGSPRPMSWGSAAVPRSARS